MCESMIITLDLLRHGETLAAGKFIGHTDTALSEQGYRQMGLALQNSSPYGQIISSPLQRCAGFAQDYGLQQGVDVTLKPELREYFFGDWEDCSTEEIWQYSPEALARFWENPVDHPPPNGETLAAFQQRVEQCLLKIIHNSPAGQILILSHGGVIRLILAHFLAMPLSSLFRLQIDYARLSRIVIHQKDGNISASVSFINQRVMP